MRSSLSPTYFYRKLIAIVFDSEEELLPVLVHAIDAAFGTEAISSADPPVVPPMRYMALPDPQRVAPQVRRAHLERHVHVYVKVESLRRPRGTLLRSREHVICIEPIFEALGHVRRVVTSGENRQRVADAGQPLIGLPDRDAVIYLAASDTDGFRTRWLEGQLVVAKYSPGAHAHPRAFRRREPGRDEDD